MVVVENASPLSSPGQDAGNCGTADGRDWGAWLLREILLVVPEGAAGESSCKADATNHLGHTYSRDHSLLRWLLRAMGKEHIPPKETGSPVGKVHRWRNLGFQGCRQRRAKDATRWRLCLVSSTSSGQAESKKEAGAPEKLLCTSEKVFGALLPWHGVCVAA